MSNETGGEAIWGVNSMPKFKTAINGKDLIMLLLYVPGFRGEPCESIEGRTRIMKMVFLFKMEVWPKFRFGQVITEKDLPDFIPYHFGPFSTGVFGDLQFLINLGLIDEYSDVTDQVSDEEALEYQWWLEAIDAEGQEATGYNPSRFALSEMGIRFVKERLLGKLKEQQLEALRAFKSRCTSVSLYTLLRYVYTHYETLTTKSRIRDEILSKRLEETHAF